MYISGLHPYSQAVFNCEVSILEKRVSIIKKEIIISMHAFVVSLIKKYKNLIGNGNFFV